MQSFQVADNDGIGETLAYDGDDDDGEDVSCEEKCEMHYHIVDLDFNIW